MGPGTHAYIGVICTCTCNTIICKITHDTGSESTVAQMVRLQFGLELKFKPWNEFSLLYFTFLFFSFFALFFFLFFFVVKFLSF